MEWKWNADAFDAIRIAAPSGEFEIVGTDSNEVTLEGDGSPRRMHGGEPEVEGRWLVFHPAPGRGDWTLALPKSKAWVLNLSLASGEVSVHDVNGRFALQTGSGEIEMQECRGLFALRSGSGDVSVERCAQAAAPEAPPRLSEAASARESERAGGIPPIPPIPPITIGMGKRKRIRVTAPEDWEEFGHEWEEWGERFAEQATRWAEKFTFKLFGEDDDDGETLMQGVRIWTGSGDAQLHEIDAANVAVRVAHGEIEIEEGRIGELDAQLSKGDLTVRNVLPTGAWDLVTRHGDLQLSLPTDAFVRLDAATRHGDIECDAPLVRVGRPGPGARHGGRMVGTVGEGAGEPVEIQLESLHGDIEIQMERRASRYARQPAQTQTQSAPVPVVNRAPATPTPPPAPETNTAVVPVRVKDLPPEGGALPPPPKKGVQVYDSQLAILEALRGGEITIAEAEMLLRSLK